MMQLGKRYTCGSCGSVVLCCTAGPGEVHCCGQTMAPMEAKSLPSSD
ncbi:hypothetical protein [Sphaerimonospora mesophila]